MATETHSEVRTPAHGTDPVHPDNPPDALAKKVFIITVLSAVAFGAVVHVFIL